MFRACGVFGGGGATGLLNKGGGSNRLPVEFPQVQTSNNNYSYMQASRSCMIIEVYVII